MLCELKQTVPPLGWELTPAEIRTGRETFRPGSLKQECRRYFIRFRRPIRHLVCGFARNGLATG